MKISIAELYQKYERKEELEGLEVTIEGYVKNSRFLGQVGFLSVNDGSSFLNLQAVFDVSKFSLENAKLGASIYLEGKIHITEQAKQPFELNVTAAKVIGPVSDSYPLQKKRTTFEYLRTIPQWRMKTNTFNAVFRVRSTLAYYIHQYFHENGFYWIHTPILTANDCEGEGQTFNVYADLKKPTEFFNKGDVKMFGNYRIEQGVYKFSLQEIIRKDFTIQEGSNISFNGSPLDAYLDIQAYYTVNSASLNDLIPNANEYVNQTNVKVNCIMGISGQLTSPDIKLDLELPNEREEVQALVRNYIPDEEQINMQILYLLGIGKFYAPEKPRNPSLLF